MFTLAFVKATLERALKTAAQSALLVVGADKFNALDFDWGNLAGFTAGGFVLSALTSIATGAFTDGNPSVGDAEVVAE